MAEAVACGVPRRVPFVSDEQPALTESTRIQSRDVRDIAAPRLGEE